MTSYTEGWARRFGLKPGIAAPLAMSLALGLMVTPEDASAAVALRSSATALGALTLFAAMLLIREWPIALTGSVWAAGTVFAAAYWLLRARYRLDGMSPKWRGAPRRSTGRRAGSATGLPLVVPVVAGLDPDDVLTATRHCFVSLQAAWDAVDIEGLRLQTTAEMLDELLQELPLRGPGPNRTDVLTLDAALLGLDECGPRYVASVEFSGMIRESSEQAAAPFKELWMLTCHKDEVPRWRLARHQALL